MIAEGSRTWFWEERERCVEPRKGNCPWGDLVYCWEERSNYKNQWSFSSCPRLCMQHIVPSRRRIINFALALSIGKLPLLMPRSKFILNRLCSSHVARGKKAACACKGKRAINSEGETHSQQGQRFGLLILKVPLRWGHNVLSRTRVC